MANKLYAIKDELSKMYLAHNEKKGWVLTSDVADAEKFNSKKLAHLAVILHCGDWNVRTAIVEYETEKESRKNG